LQYGWLYLDEDDINKDISKQLALPSIEQQAQIEDKPFNIDTWKFKNQNFIMYVPDGKYHFILIFKTDEATSFDVLFLDEMPSCMSYLYWNFNSMKTAYFY